jgi:signal transduction histidine kinase
VRVHRRQLSRAPEDLAGRVSRLDHLPLRAATARAVLNSLPEAASDEWHDIPDSGKARSVFELDPGWAQAIACSPARFSPLQIVADACWWPVSSSGSAVEEMIARLWRHSVAVSIAARQLARDAGDSDPGGVARASLLCRLGCWAVASVDPEWLLRWWQDESPALRRQREIADLGTELDDLGRRLAERWGCDPLVIDAAWLHSDRTGALRQAASQATRLAYIQEACRWVEQTPWALDRCTQGPMPTEPRLRILVAEVQARSGAAFAAADATGHEEKLARQSARLRLLLSDEREARERSDRFLQALAAFEPAESPVEWASRAALTWCAEPEVSRASVIWVDMAANAPVEGLQASTHPVIDDQREAGADAREPGPGLVVPLEVHGRARALIRLWSHRDLNECRQRLASDTMRKAWGAWATMVHDRAILERRLASVVAAVHQETETEEARLEQRKLDALSEFAAGAGHELNNPLAVIVGRAQLLLSRTDDAETARSLRIMLNQAGRAHRILRDLMFVGRPPGRRLRSCRPSELLRESVRDFQEECAARGIRLSSEIDEAVPPAWTDPDALRHLADILIRNAVQATPSGGKIQVGSRLNLDDVLWWFSDSGPGLAPAEAAHLFDPFFCGRQAGRGLGLGLPRAARIVEMAGGLLSWSSNPGQGTVFQINLPLPAPPEQIALPPLTSSRPARNGDRPHKGPPHLPSQAVASQPA